MINFLSRTVRKLGKRGSPILSRNTGDSSMSDPKDPMVDRKLVSKRDSPKLRGDEHDQSWEKVKDLYGPFIAMAVVMYVTSSTILRYFDPRLLYSIGIIVSGAIMFSFLESVIENKKLKKLCSIILFSILTYATYNFTTLLDFYGKASQANDQRCYQLELDMLSAKPRRSDGPDIFQALGCRPQGYENVSFPQTSAVAASPS